MVLVRAAENGLRYGNPLSFGLVVRKKKDHQWSRVVQRWYIEFYYL